MIPNTPVLSPLHAIGKYRLVSDWDFRACGVDFHIPSGYTYDGASIPRFFWRVTYSPFDPVVMIPALEHDWLCDIEDPRVDYVQAADHFYRRLQQANAGSTRAKLMHQAVLKFGPRWP